MSQIQFEQKSVTTVPYHATARYRVEGKSHQSPFTIALPADVTPGQRIFALQTHARVNYAADGVSGLTVVYRSDGSDKPITKWEKFTDIFRLLFMFQGVIERRLYVPVWPRPAAAKNHRSTDETQLIGKTEGERSMTLQERFESLQTRLAAVREITKARLASTKPLSMTMLCRLVDADASNLQSSLRCRESSIEEAEGWTAAYEGVLA